MGVWAGDRKVWGKKYGGTCTVITKWDLVGGCCREVGAEVGVGGWSRWCRLPGTSSRRMPPPTAFTGSPAHGHGHAQPRRHRRHRHHRRRCPPLPAPRLHLQPPPSCRAASSCGLHVDAASADTRAAVALSLGCHLCMLLVVPCRSKACCVQLHCRAGGSSCIVLCTEAESECIDAWHLPLFAGSLGRVEQVAKTRVAFCRSFSERGASRR